MLLSFVAHYSSLPRFAVQRHLALARAVLLQFHPLWVVALILFRRVVAVAAFRALKRDDCAIRFSLCHCYAPFGRLRKGLRTED